MKPATLQDMLELAFDYASSDIERGIQMEVKAAEYSESFNESYAERLEHRDADRKQWKNVILPSIQKRAMLAEM